VLRADCQRVPSGWGFGSADRPQVHTTSGAPIWALPHRQALGHPSGMYNTVVPPLQECITRPAVHRSTAELNRKRHPSVRAEHVTRQ